MVCFYHQKIDPHLFCIDNTDLKTDTFDGKNQLHQTSFAVYKTTNGDKKRCKGSLIITLCLFSSK